MRSGLLYIKDEIQDKSCVLLYLIYVDVENTTEKGH